MIELHVETEVHNIAVLHNVVLTLFGQSTRMTKEEFFTKVDEAREEIRQGKGKRFSKLEEMNAWLNSL